MKNYFDMGANMANQIVDYSDNLAQAIDNCLEGKIALSSDNLELYAGFFNERLTSLQYDRVLNPALFTEHCDDKLRAAQHYLAICKDLLGA